MKKYMIVLDGNTKKITNNKTDKSKFFDIREFVYGQGMFNEKTEKYPDYMVNNLWRQYHKQKNR